MNSGDPGSGEEEQAIKMAMLQTIVNITANSNIGCSTNAMTDLTHSPSFEWNRWISFSTTSISNSSIESNEFVEMYGAMLCLATLDRISID